MELIGSVLWWSDKDGNGIIIDSNRNEFYFDISVLKLKTGQKITAKSIVIFKPNNCITDVLCAKNVHVPLLNQKKIIEKKLKTLLLQG